MRLAILTPDPQFTEYAEYAAPLIERYRVLFAPLGVDVIPTPWTETPPEGLDAAAAMLAWGYHLDLPRWLAALDAWSARTTLINDVTVLRWNTRKTYLTELVRAGVPIVPTIMAAQADGAAIARAAELLGADDLVVKPQVSAAGYRTVRLRSGEEPADIIPDAMIQPFLPAVCGDGELSLFFFAGSFNYAVRKVAAAGEFRVQAHYGGRFSAFEPEGDVLETAARALTAAPGPVTYARIDLVRGVDGRPCVMELEAIEPDLYFDFAPDGGLGYAKAVIATIRANGPRASRASLGAGEEPGQARWQA